MSAWRSVQLVAAEKSRSPRHAQALLRRRALGIGGDGSRVTPRLFMAIPAHLAVLTARALPARWVRVAAVTAHLVTADAVGGWPLIVAARTQKNVSPRSGAVEAARVRVVADPARRVRIASFDQARAYAARGVTRVARLGRMAALATCGLGLCLQGVRGQEVTAMHKASGHRLRSAALDRQVLTRVVATVTIGLLMAGLTQALLLGSLGSVMLHEIPRMLEERLRQEPLYLGLGVAGRALPSAPLFLMLVATETSGHRRQARAPSFDDARVTVDALSLDLR